MIDRPTGPRAAHLRRPRLAALLAGAVLLAAPPGAMSQQPAAAGSPAAGTRSAGAVEGFEHVLPPDTFAFFGVADVDAAGRNLGSTAYGAWWRDPANAALREGLQGVVKELGDKLTAEIGVNPLDLPAMARGRLALAVAGDLAASATKSDRGPHGFALVLLADVGVDRTSCDAIVASVLDDTGKGTHTIRRIEDIDGTEITVLEDVGIPGKTQARMRVAFHGDTLVVVFEMLPIEHDVMAFILEGLGGAAAPSLADLPAFRDSLAAQPADVHCWIDVGTVLRLNVVVAELANEPIILVPAGDEEREGPPSEFLDTARRCGFLDVGALSMAVSWSSSGSRVRARLDWPGDGFIPMLARCLLAPGDAGLLPLAPGTALGALGAHIAFGDLFDRIVQVAMQTGKASPSEVVEFLAKAHETLGFDLLEALDGRFSMSVFVVPPEDGVPVGPLETPVNLVVTIGLHDGAAMNSLIEAFVSRTSAKETRRRTELLGVEVFHIPFVPGRAVHYAFLPDMAVISGSETLMNDMLRRLAGDSSLPVLARDSVFNARLQQIEMPAGLMDYTVAEVGLLTAANVFETARSALVRRLNGSQSDDWVLLLAKRLDGLPDIDRDAVTRHFDGGMLTTLTMDERGLRFESASP